MVALKKIGVVKSEINDQCGESWEFIDESQYNDWIESFIHGQCKISKRF